MKIQKLFTIDKEHDEPLKKINASGLVNDLLHMHFSTKGRFTKEELIEGIKEAELIIVEKKSRLEKLKNMLEEAKAKESEPIKCPECKITMNKLLKNLWKCSKCHVEIKDAK